MSVIMYAIRLTTKTCFIVFLFFIPCQTPKAAPLICKNFDFKRINSWSSDRAGNNYLKRNPNKTQEGEQVPQTDTSHGFHHPRQELIPVHGFDEP